jgi:hypothetical protein
MKKALEVASIEEESNPDIILHFFKVLSMFKKLIDFCQIFANTDCRVTEND